MSVPFYKIFTALFTLGVSFIYIVVFELQPSLKHEASLQYASSLKSDSGLSLSNSAYYQSNDFYLGISKDNYMSFAYVK